MGCFGPESSHAPWSRRRLAKRRAAREVAARRNDKAAMTRPKDMGFVVVHLTSSVQLRASKLSLLNQTTSSDRLLQRGVSRCGRDYFTESVVIPHRSTAATRQGIMSHCNF